MKKILAVCVGVALELARDECLSVSSLLKRNDPDGSEFSVPSRTDCALLTGVPSVMLVQLLVEQENPEGRLVWMESPMGAPYAVFELTVSGWCHKVLLPLASRSVRRWLMELWMQAEMCLLLSSRDRAGGRFLRVPLARSNFPEEVWDGIWRAPKKSQLKSYFEVAAIFVAEHALRRGLVDEGKSGVALRHSVSILVPDELEIETFDGLRAALPSL